MMSVGIDNFYLCGPTVTFIRQINPTESNQFPLWSLTWMVY